MSKIIDKCLEYLPATAGFGCVAGSAYLFNKALQKSNEADSGNVEFVAKNVLKDSSKKLNAKSFGFLILGAIILGMLYIKNTVKKSTPNLPQK